MKFYLASRYSRREELLGVRDVVEELGGQVTSRWLNGNHQLDNAGVPITEDGEAQVEAGDTERAAQLRQKFARDDIEDVLAADVIVAFTEEPRTTNSRGGRHVELGIALGAGKRVIVVGPRENIFCWLPWVDHHEDWSRAALAITRMLRPVRA